MLKRLLRVLKGSEPARGTGRSLWTAIALSNLLVVAMVALALHASRLQHIAATTRMVESMSSVLRHDVGGLLDKLDIALQNVVEEHARQLQAGGPDDKAMAAFIARQGRHVPEVLLLGLADAEGRVRFSSTGPVPAGANVADRERFRRLRDDPRAGLAMDGPELGRVSGKWVLVFARRLDDRHGAFAGEVHASLEVSQLQSLLGHVHLGTSGITTLWSTDRRLVARLPAAAPQASSNMSDTVQSLLDRGQREGAYEAISRIDGIRRILYFRHIEGRSLILTVGLGELDYLLPWRREAWIMSGLAALFCALTLLSGLFIHRGLRRQAAAAGELERARNDLQAILDNVPALIGYWDRNLRNRFGNHAYSDWFGIAPRALVGRHIRELLGEEAYRFSFPMMERVLAGEVQRFEREIVRNGEHRQAFVSYIPDLRDGKVAGFYAMLIDITALKQAREEASSASRRSQLLLQAASDGIHILDTGGNLREVNEAFGRMLGYTREELLSMNLRQWDAAMSEDEVTRALKSLQEQRTTFETLHRRRDGSLLDVEISSIGVEVDGERLIFCAARDITERKRAEQALRESGERFSRIFHASPAGIAMGRAEDGRFIEVNDTFAATLGYTVDEFVGKNGEDLGLWAEARQRDEFLAALRAGQRVSGVEAAWYSKAGMVMDLLLYGEPLDIGGEPHLLVFIMDITHQKEAQRALTLYGQQMEEMVAERTAELRQAQQESERLALAKSEFLANMSHEIRTPLNAVLGLAQLGQRQSAGRKVEDTFGRILDAGKLLLGTVNDILDFSKIEAGKLSLEHERVGLGDLVDRAVDMVAPQAQGRRHRFSLSEAAGLPEAFHGDGLRLAQVLVNLLNNAIKFTEPGGRISLSVEWQAPNLVFRVVDNGIGMSIEQIGRLFQPFEQADGSTTRRFGGTGLGLSICKRLVSLMGGEILVSSAPGKGSEFTVSLPVEALPDSPRPPVPGPVALVGLEAGEAGDLARALGLLGVDTLLPASGTPLPAAALVLADRAVVADVEAACPPGTRIAMVSSAGQGEAPALMAEDMPVLHRPLRARHVLALMTGPATALPALPASGRRLAALRILAAEDNDVNRAVLEEMLGFEGASLTCLENGRLAVEQLRRDGAGHYALLLTDIQMPEMDGFETARQVHGLDPALPVVGLTAHALAEERERCLAAGMVEHVSKPFDIDHLVAVILRHARPASPRPEAQRPATAAAPPAGTGLVDWPGLVGRYRGKAAFIGRLLKMAVDSTPHTVDELRAARARQDYPALAEVAHRQKGVAGNLAAEPCRLLAERTDHAARERDPAALVLALELAEAVTALSAELASRLGPDGLYQPADPPKEALSPRP